MNSTTRFSDVARSRSVLGAAVIAAAVLTVGAAATPADAFRPAAQCGHHSRMLHTPRRVLYSHATGTRFRAYVHFDDGVLDSSFRGRQQLELGPDYA